MNYRSYHDMSLAIWQYIPRLPVRYDLIVGVPQSGMVPASILSAYLKVWLASLDLFVSGACMTNGMTRNDHGTRTLRNFDGIHNVLVIDDSILSGEAIREAKKRIEDSAALKKYSNLRIDYAAVYSNDGNDKDILFCFAICPLPRVFQWNIFNHPNVTKNSCYDIDGVLCDDPTPEQNDDGMEYENFLSTAAKRVNIKFPIGALVSSRLEKYRSQTIKWLRENGFVWKDLILLDLPSKDERIRTKAHASFKAQIYRDRPETLFVESEWEQAREIAHLSGKDVFCTETMLYINGQSSTSRQQDKPLMLTEIELLRLQVDEFQRMLHARNEMRQQLFTMREARDGARDNLLKMRIARDEARDNVLQMRAARDEACDNVLKMRAARDEACDNVLKMRAARDEACDNVLKMRAARDEACDNVLKMRAARDEARQEIVTMREARDAACRELGLLQKTIKELDKVINGVVA